MKCRSLLWALTLLLAAPAASETSLFRVVSEGSHFIVHVGKAGMFSVFGHDHLIEVRAYEGTVRWDAEAPEAAQFALEVKADSLTVADEDVSDDERVQIQSDMESKALGVTDHPAIAFESESVEIQGSENGKYSLRLKGRLELRGVRKDIEVPLTLTVSDTRLTATGEMNLRGKTWGVPQISAAGGAVKTKDELLLTFELVAVRE